jgi:hypothetical protein
MLANISCLKFLVKFKRCKSLITILWLSPVIALFCFAVAVEELEEDVEAVEEIAQQIYAKHSSLLGKGFALASAPTINQALEGVLPFRYVFRSARNTSQVLLRRSYIYSFPIQ